jgi:hypothetical protein
MPFKIVHPKAGTSAAKPTNVPKAFIAFGSRFPGTGAITGLLTGHDANGNPAGTNISPVALPSRPNCWRLYFKGLDTSGNVYYKLDVWPILFPYRKRSADWLKAGAYGAITWQYPLDPSNDVEQCSACVVGYGIWDPTVVSGVLSGTLSGTTNYPDNDPFLDTSNYFWCVSFYSVDDGYYSLSVQPSPLPNQAPPPAVPCPVSPLDVEAAYC